MYMFGVPSIWFVNVLGSQLLV